MFKWTDKDGTAEYQCYQLLPVSRNVIVIKYSDTFTGQLIAEDECTSDTIPLEYSSWPLTTMSKDARSNNNQCGFEGGFEFYVKVNEMEFCKTPDKSMKPRMEVGCSQNPGMYLDFHNFICEGLLDVMLEQKLSCLGNWERGPYRFSVVTDDADLWPKIWLLRFPKVTKTIPEFEMLMFPDIEMEMESVPESTAMRHIHVLVVRRKEFATVCEDEAHSFTCNKICSIDDDGELELDDIFCQKSCGKCPHNQGECNFPDEVKGEWEEIGENGDHHIVLTSSVLYVDDLSPMKCLNLSGYMEHTQPVVSFFKNGCKPQYNCVYLHARGPNVVQYDLKDPVLWPFKNDLASGDICNTNQTFASSSDSSHSKILVKDVGKQPVNCGITGMFEFKGKKYSSSNEATCSGIIKSCDFKDVFRVEYDECEETSQTYQCIASFEEGTSKFLITESEDNPRVPQCWVVQKFEEDPHITVYKLSLPACHSGISLDIRHGKYHSYDMAYNVSGSTSLTDEKTCNRVPKTVPTPEAKSSKPSTQSTTTPIKLITQNIPPNKPTTEKPYSWNAVGPLKSTTGAACRLTMYMNLVLFLLSFILYCM